MLYGPRREGKTVGAIARILRVASTNPSAWPLVVACVRDTWTNLQRTVIKSIKDGGAWGWWDAEWRQSDTECILDGGKVHIYFFGMDRPADANKFQSFEAGLLWIEEPAPAADLASGVPIDVFAIGVSSLSQKGFKGGVQITMNPPDDEHWTIKLLDNLITMDRPEMTVGDHWIRPGENKHVSAEYRVRFRLAMELAGRYDLVARLSEGRVHSPKLGEPVAPGFIEHAPHGAQHVAREPIDIQPYWDTFRFWDFGLNPTCVFAQTSPMGHLNVIGALVGENQGIEEFIPRRVLPWQATFKIIPRVENKRAYGRGQRQQFRIRDIGDPAGNQREQSSSERSARKALEALLRTTFEPGPIEWPARRDSIGWVLQQDRGPHKMLQIDPDEGKPLIRALRGDWHYAKSSAGILSRLPVKNIASHPGDAFGYGCGVLFPAHLMLRAALRDEPYRPPPPTSQPASWLGR